LTFVVILACILFLQAGIYNSCSVQQILTLSCVHLLITSKTYCMHIVNCLTIFLTALMTANWIVLKCLFKMLATCLTFSARSPKTATLISSQYSDKHCKLR